MTWPLGARQRDRVLAVAVAVFAASYVAAARAIEDSLLSDSVGAGGVPTGVGIAMFVAAVALFAKSFLGTIAPDAALPKTGADAAPAPGRREPMLRTVALVAVLVVYAVLLPILGYPVTVSLLVLATGWLAGAALRAPLLLCAAAAGPGLWLMFDRLLQVRMPVGSVWG